jgi:hypothetical protein
MYFNKEWQPSIVEVVKEKKDLPKDFPIQDFLKLYNEWNALSQNSSIDESSHDRQSLFAKLRDFHQQYGVNTNRGMDFWNAEEEIHAFAQYLQKVQENKKATQTRLSDARESVSQKTAESITIGGNLVKKGDTIILNDSKATFTWNYKVDANGNILEIEITINGQSWYAQVKDITFREDGTSAKSTSPERDKTLRYTLAVYKGFAEQELKKHGKTIKDLQEALKTKWNYTGEVNGKFDQATLDAVIAFQKTIPNPKYGGDGLVGSEETIPALFGIAPQENTRVSKNAANTSPSKSTKDDNSQPARVRNTSSSSGSSSDSNRGSASVKLSEKNNTSKATVEQAYKDFIAYAENTDKFLAWFRNSKEDIQNIRTALSDKFEKFNTAINAYIKSGGTMEDVNWMRLNIAYYYTDDLSGVSSNNQMDIVRSMNLCLDILGDKISKIPSIAQQEEDTMSKIWKENPKLTELISNKIAEQVARNETPNISAILSHPMIKWSWERAFGEIYGTYLQKLDNELDVLKGQKLDTLSESQKKALNHIRDIRGKDGIFDFTVQNREQMWQMLKYGSAIGAGILATIPTGGTSLWMLALGAWIGATVTTTGTLLAQGYRWSIGEVAGEAWINLLSFGGGAILFKMASWARAIALAEKTSKVVVYWAEWIGNIGIGVGTDMLRARLHWEDLDIYNSIQQNLVWAALPFALRMRWAKVPPNIEADATTVNESLRAANTLSTLGKSPKTLLERMRAPLDRLKVWGEKSNIPARSDLESFKSMHLSGDSLYEKVTKLGGGEKIDIEWLPGYKIWMTEDRKMLHIIGPDKVWYKLYKDQLEANLEECYKRVHSATIPSVKNLDSSTQSPPKAQPEKNPQKTSERVSQQAHNPQAAHSALESIAKSDKKLGTVFSTEWLEKIAKVTGKSVGWVADQSVGPVVRMLTGNNPSNLLSLAVPWKWYTEKAMQYGKELGVHWKNPVRNSINLLFTWEKKEWQWAIASIAKNVIFAWWITALDYFAVPNNQAHTPANMAQNYYEMILLGWLWIVLMENWPILEWAKDMKNWLSDRMQAKPF